MAESPGVVTEPHHPQGKVSAGLRREVRSLGYGPQACWAAPLGSQRRSLVLEAAAKTPRRLQLQGAERCGPGGCGRAEIRVAPAPEHLQAWGAHTRGTWVWKSPRRGASFLQHAGGRVLALEEPRAGGQPRAPARHPADRPGAGTGRRPGAWRRSPRAPLLRCAGLLPAPVREAQRLCPGMAGDAGRGRRGFFTGQTLAWGKD